MVPQADDRLKKIEEISSQEKVTMEVLVSDSDSLDIFNSTSTLYPSCISVLLSSFVCRKRMKKPSSGQLILQSSNLVMHAEHGWTG